MNHTIARTEQTSSRESESKSTRTEKFQQKMKHRFPSSDHPAPALARLSASALGPNYAANACSNCSSPTIFSELPGDGPSRQGFRRREIPWTMDWPGESVGREVAEGDRTPLSELQILRERERERVCCESEGREREKKDRIFEREIGNHRF